MVKKVIQVQSGENLAALLKAFPQAEVGTLIGDPGRDSWRVTIEVEEGVPQEEETEETLDLEPYQTPPPFFTVMFIMRVQVTHRDREWWIYTIGTEAASLSWARGVGSLKDTKESFFEAYGRHFWKEVRVKGVKTPEEAQDYADRILRMSREDWAGTMADVLSVDSVDSVDEK